MRILKPSTQRKSAKYPKSVKWEIHAKLTELDHLLAYLESHLEHKALVCRRDRMFLERIGIFVFESVSNVIEHRVLGLTKHQVYENLLSYRQLKDSHHTLGLELILTPCRVRLVMSYPTKPLYFAPLRARKRLVDTPTQNLGGYGLLVMKQSFGSFKHTSSQKVALGRSVFVLRLD